MNITYRFLKLSEKRREMEINANKTDIAQTKKKIKITVYACVQVLSSPCELHHK